MAPTSSSLDEFIPSEKNQQGLVEIFINVSLESKTVISSNLSG
jgi:hypothetical protein